MLLLDWFRTGIVFKGMLKARII